MDYWKDKYCEVCGAGAVIRSAIGHACPRLWCWEILERAYDKKRADAEKEATLFGFRKTGGTWDDAVNRAMIGYKYNNNNLQKRV